MDLLSGSQTVTETFFETVRGALGVRVRSQSFHRRLVLGSGERSVLKSALESGFVICVAAACCFIIYIAQDFFFSFFLLALAGVSLFHLNQSVVLFRRHAESQQKHLAERTLSK